MQHAYAMEAGRALRVEVSPGRRVCGESKLGSSILLTTARGARKLAYNYGAAVKCAELPTLMVRGKRHG
jgi:hypothetical protein